MSDCKKHKEECQTCLKELIAKKEQELAKLKAKLLVNDSQKEMDKLKELVKDLDKNPKFIPVPYYPPIQILPVVQPTITPVRTRPQVWCGTTTTTEAIGKDYSVF